MRFDVPLSVILLGKTYTRLLADQLRSAIFLHFCWHIFTFIIIKHVVSLSHSIARAELQKHSLTLLQMLLKANVQAKQKYMQQYLNISLQPDQKYSVPLAAPGFNSSMCGTARDWILFLVAHQLKFTSIRTPTAFSIMQGVSIRVK